MIETIPASRLLIAFIPVIIVIALMWRWQLTAGKALYAMFRMLVQLLLIGYVLVFIFNADSSLIVLAVLFIMIFASSVIALNSIDNIDKALYRYSFFAILLGGGFTLALITTGVLQLEPWYAPRYMIPLAGMVFANSMNSVSLAAERFYAERKHGDDYCKARDTAFQAAMIPNINALLAVGLVSLPGMMTGQILSGVSPFIAARYQIMVMCMVFSSSGISTALFLYWLKKKAA